MRASIPLERLQEIRRELKDDRVFTAVLSRKTILRDLQLAHDRLKRVERILAMHKGMNNPHGVAANIGEKLFAETLIKTLERRLSECRV